MSRTKKSSYKPRAFESDCSKGDTSANIYHSMLISEAFNSLTPTQKNLYLYCKAQLYAERKKPTTYTGLSNDDFFTMNMAKWADKYHLYAKNNARGFYRDRDALIEKGFIEFVENNKTRRTRNIYRFSSRWRDYKMSAK